MQDLLIPNVVPMPFANQGDKNQIPTNATGSQLASYQEGFPVITQTAIEEGGIPPERNDFNGILYLLSQWQYAFQNGWLPTFNNDVSNAIGGYAINAILWYYPTTGTDANRAVPLRSLVANNVYNFNENADYIGVYWGRVDGFITPEQLAATVASLNQAIDTKTDQTDFNALAAKVPALGAAGLPNFSAGVSISSGATLPIDALVVITGNPGNYGVTQLFIDGVEVYCGGVSENSPRHKAGNVIARKGSVITTGGYVSSLTYYPLV